MADIKVDLSTGHKVANPFKTVRKSSTNPFKYSNFEGDLSFKGNTLQFADVFAGYKPLEKTNKLKMIASTIAGSMTKLRTGITEPIVNFVKRVGTDISHAWEYANNLNVTKFGSYKPIAKIMNTDIVELGKGISHSISEKTAFLNTDIVDIGKGIGHTISEKTAFLRTDITDIGKVIGEKLSLWTDNINLNHKDSLKDKSVAELKDLWIEENNKVAKEVKLTPETVQKAMVA